MSYNGSGTFLINTAGQPVVSGTVISSTAFNALTADLATGLSTAITKDGQTTITANIPMGSYKFTGLGAGSAATDSANLSQVQSTTAKLLATIAGADTITATASPTLTAYAAGQMFYFVAAADNTGAVTLNIDSLGAKSVTRDGSVALAAADIKSGEVVVVVYDGTRFQVVSQINSAGDVRFANVSITSTLYVGGVATIVGQATIDGMAVGQGGGDVATNTAVGVSALAVNQAGGTDNTAIGYQVLDANTTGDFNVGVGSGALGGNTTASYNTGVGYQAGLSNTTGAGLTAVGGAVLLANTSGTGNTAMGGFEGISSAAMRFNTTGSYNVAIGTGSLSNNVSSSNNTAVGYQSLYSNTAANNTAVGYQAGYANTSGADNVAVGINAFDANTTGSNNIAVGRDALGANTTANNSTAVGHQAGYSNTTGAENTFVGQTAGYSNQTNTQLTFVGVSAGYYMRGSYNTGIGWNSMAGSTTAANNTGTYNTALGRSTLYVLTSGSRNTAIGNTALNQTSTGSDNTAVGNAALEVNTTGTYNVAVGAYALDANTTANYNTAVGYGSLTSTTAADNSGFGRDSGAACTSGTANTFIGARAGDAVTTGSYNILVGFQSGAYDGLGNAKLTTGSFNTQIGYACAMSASTVSGEMLIASGGYNFVGKGANTGFIQPNGGGVYQGNNSANWSTTSDQRLKKNIADNTIGLEKIKQIRVRNFEYRLPEEVDAELKPTDAIAKSGVQLGVIAQELQQVLPECVKQESTGVMSVDPDNLTWYLINAVKELSAQVEELKAKLGDK